MNSKPPTPASGPKSCHWYVFTNQSIKWTYRFKLKTDTDTRQLVFQQFHPGGMVRYCGRLREVIFFLSMVPRATGEVRGVFGGPLATCSSNMFGVVEPTREAAAAQGLRHAFGHHALRTASQKISGSVRPRAQHRAAS